MYIYTVVKDGRIFAVDNNIQELIKTLATNLSFSAHGLDNEYVHFQIEIETWEI